MDNVQRLFECCRGIETETEFIVYFSYDSYLKKQTVIITDKNNLTEPLLSFEIPIENTQRRVEVIVELTEFRIKNSR